MCSSARRFGTGSVPGWPVHTGQIWVFGAPPKVVAHEQNILDAVESSTWHSSPMTGSHSATTAAASGTSTGTGNSADTVSPASSDAGSVAFGGAVAGSP